MNEHLAFMRARFDDGSLRVGGPLATEESGLALFEAADLATARDLVDQDPAAQADVLVYELPPAPAVLRRAQRRPRGRSREGPGQARPDPRLTLPRRSRPVATAPLRTPPRWRHPPWTEHP